jgi:uncharacterized protein YndB with AHSA1/START domain
MSSVRVTRRYDARPEAVFDAFVDPARVGRFLFATDAGEMVRVDIDARAGGAFVITERRDGEDIEHAGEYIEVDRPRRLSFDFSVPKFSTQRTRVTIDIVPSGDAAAELTLTHDGVLEGWEEKTKAGWETILEGLARVVSSGAS